MHRLLVDGGRRHGYGRRPVRLHRVHPEEALTFARANAAALLAPVGAPKGPRSTEKEREISDETFRTLVPCCTTFHFMLR